MGRLIPLLLWLVSGQVEFVRRRLHLTLRIYHLSHNDKAGRRA